MKLKLSILNQIDLMAALRALDAYETVAKVNGEEKMVRTPFKLGAHRRHVVKNINTLRPSLEAYEEAHKQLFKEVWPEKNTLDNVKRSEDPENFDKFNAEWVKMTGQEDEFDLTPLPATVMYGDDFPVDALSVLEKHGLISE